MSRFLVTGATGFIGGRVAALLRARGDAVVALVREPARAEALAALGCTLHRGDLGEPAALRAAMAGADGVFHLAGWYKVGVRSGAEGERINVEGTRHVLAAMRATGVARGVYTSSLAVYGDTGGEVVREGHPARRPFLSHYDRTKHDAHVLAEAAMRDGLPLVVVQPGLVYGPGDTSSVRTTLRQYLTRTLPLVPAGTAYAWAHVDDIARGHLLAMDRGRVGECYHLAGPVATLVEALALAERITGIRGPGWVAPRALLRTLAAMLTPVAAVLPLEGQYHPENLRVVGGATYLGRSDKAQRELGWTARPLAEGLRETLLHEMRLLGMPLPEGAGGAA
jgi:nucleoside-diphosphate-sugar epimerase